ncbi:MAG: hypothetical protein L6R42_008204 [Xanthoria sp. 1 TBL-2021]|nr:MAG: hypothetical protein L6R42_008204 [Xanthoria sp. 1 TBL-2021]
MSDQRTTAAEVEGQPHTDAVWCTGLGFEESWSTIKPKTGRNIQKVTSIPRIIPQASDKEAMRHTLRMKMPKYEASILLGLTPTPNYLEKWDTGPSSIGPTSLDLERSMDSWKDQAALVTYSQQSFSSYLAENPGMERHLIENHSFSWNVNMDQFRKMLHDDEEWRREFSKDTTGLAPRGIAGENGQTTLTHKAPEAKKDSGSSDDLPPQSVTNERSMKVSRRVTRDKASNHPVDSDKS